MSERLPAFCFQDDELVITTSTQSYRIRAWPQPAAHEQLEDGTWKEIRPGFCLVKPDFGSSLDSSGHNDIASPDRIPGLPALLPDILEDKRKAFAALRSQMPPRVAHSVEPFQSHQWNLIDLLSKEEAAQDLADSNPVLAWCLANNDQFRRLYRATSPVERARPLVSRRQVEILQWLGFTSSDAMVRLMRKILPEAITPPDARMLRQALVEPEVARLLGHLRSVNAGILGLVCNLKLLPVISPQLLAEVSRSEDERTRQPAADLLINALYIMTVSLIHLRVPRFLSIAAIRDFHDRMTAEAQRKIEVSRTAAQARRKRKIPTPPSSFPPPPVPGTQDIVPLTTPGQLKSEGSVQHNCVGTYAQKVRAGDVYIYKVLSPERATLAITLGPDGFWRRSEIECARNRPVSNSTKAAVDQWLSLYSLSI
jgi:hypothetical protein